jgi:hypothetical protein
MINAEPWHWYFISTHVLWNRQNCCVYRNLLGTAFLESLGLI